MIRRFAQARTWIHQLAATLAAAASGAWTLARGGESTGKVELARGDRAPDFTLPGSDGRTYRLADLIGHGERIVIAWFPRAFTGG